MSKYVRVVLGGVCTVLLFSHQLWAENVNYNEIFHSGGVAFNTGDYAAARKAFSKLDTDDAPSEIRKQALYFLALTHLGENRLDQATSSLKKVVRLASANDTFSIRARNNLITAAGQLADRNDWSSVYQALDGVSMQSISHDVAYAGYGLFGTAAYQMNDPDRVISNLKMLTRTSIWSGNYSFMLGTAYAQKRQFDMAIRHLKDALDSQDVTPEQKDFVLYILAGISLELKNMDVFKTYLGGIRSQSYRDALMRLEKGE